ncbi:Sodium- and chloride-dependent glycine transporter 2 [Nymphon striatum]|nr:Sodium- and chloride-dependent glycine transporter 2 [Nymphon striatum]KAG1708440.1 Sodium- and chloride-dependent glycine transporter 2 [Nymphon striatum]
MADNTEKIPQKEVESQGEDVGPERGAWGGKLEFFLTCLAQAVGLGNVWRFPYLAFKHGGGSFLIPYTIMLILVAMPILFLELALGQYSALGSLPLVKNISPIFTGIGYAIYFCQYFGGVTYNAVISWTLFYFCVSMAKTLPWRNCDHDFNTKDCFDDREYGQCISQNSSNVYYSNTCFPKSEAELYNYTNIPEEARQTPSEEYLK